MSVFERLPALQHKVQYAADAGTDIGQVPVAQTARSAAAILEWLEVAGPQSAADLSVSCLDAVISERPGLCSVSIHGLTITGSDAGDALGAWCNQVLRDLEAMNGVDPLVTFFQAFGTCRSDKFHAITMAAARAGCGSWVDPTAPAQRITSHFYEIEMFGVLGRGDSATGAIENWRAAAVQQLPARMEAAFAEAAA